MQALRHSLVQRLHHRPGVPTCGSEIRGGVSRRVARRVIREVERGAVNENDAIARAGKKADQGIRDAGQNRHSRCIHAATKAVALQDDVASGAESAAKNQAVSGIEGSGGTVRVRQRSGVRLSAIGAGSTGAQGQGENQGR